MSEIPACLVRPSRSGIYLEVVPVCRRCSLMKTQTIERKRAIESGFGTARIDSKRGIRCRERRCEQLHVVAYSSRRQPRRRQIGHYRGIRGRVTRCHFEEVYSLGGAASCERSYPTLVEVSVVISNVLKKFAGSPAERQSLGGAMPLSATARRNVRRIREADDSGLYGTVVEGLRGG